jgi:peroxiredoxin
VKRIALGLIALAVSGIALADPPAAPPAPPQVGETAPDFKLPYATRDSVADDSLQLSAMEGQHNIVLAFYPADWSGGCTKEVCSLRDNFSALGAVNADVIGISGDYVFSHHEWAKHHNLPFRLASDHSHAVAKRYASYYEQYGFNKRTVFVVNRQGKIAYEDMAYSPRDSVSYMKLQSALKGIQ